MRKIHTHTHTVQCANTCFVNSLFDSIEFAALSLWLRISRMCVYIYLLINSINTIITLISAVAYCHVMAHLDFNGASIALICPFFSVVPIDLVFFFSFTFKLILSGFVCFFFLFLFLGIFSWMFYDMLGKSRLLFAYNALGHLLYAYINIGCSCGWIFLL